MSTVTVCPACHGTAVADDDGTIICATEGFTMSREDAAGIRQAQAIVGSIAAGWSVQDTLARWGGRQ